MEVCFAIDCWNMRDMSEKERERGDREDYLKRRKFLGSEDSSERDIPRRIWRIESGGEYFIICWDDVEEEDEGNRQPIRWSEEMSVRYCREDLIFEFKWNEWLESKETSTTWNTVELLEDCVPNSRPMEFSWVIVGRDWSVLKFINEVKLFGRCNRSKVINGRTFSICWIVTSFLRLFEISFDGRYCLGILFVNFIDIMSGRQVTQTRNRKQAFPAIFLKCTVVASVAG